MPLETVTKELYSTSATSKGGREGNVKSADGVIDLATGKPGSTSNPKANPETLFAAGYAACFCGALNAVAGRAGIDASESTVTAEVSFGETESGFGIGVKLTAKVPGVDQAKAQELVDQAHQFCPYSKATRGNIEVTVTAV
ncbi:organic hydroperoxide resistance protein [Rudaeicoccus suwonensis]|uniref:Ohr subfamily peroxiredoxin n=1 Tax=Rudaeicoccus suwonensis TaxID=657409 RepID=A0A561E0X6_9MICO|nr:organic hydroperoxide resistance protein [Rudaeicoccus suwonensis]TWE09253.1 Ohr subfamily peroxiredoxin [Rudaeicoccus suwonensis]